MLRNVIEDYLTSTKELQFFLPFTELLELCGYHDIHVIHSSVEFGKDIIAKKQINGETIQFTFQLKIGDINLPRFRDQIQSQLIQALTNKLSHPNFDRALPYQVVLVTTGELLPPATIAVQEFNEFVRDNLKQKPVQTWEKTQLITDFLNKGVEPFFALHRSPQFVSKFFKLYSEIANGDLISSFDIEDYARGWLDLNWADHIERMQVYLEAYFFSKLLLDKGKHYEAALMLSALVRVLMKHKALEEYWQPIVEYLDEIILAHFEKAKSVYVPDRPFEMDFQGVFALFYHPISCLRTLELLSLHILISRNRKTEIEAFFRQIIDEQRGSYRILSDNYAISIVLVSLALLKLGESDRLRKYLNNVCVWLCDRFAEFGLAPIGSSLQEEIEQLLSEHLDGLSHHRHAGGFSASASLDMAYLLNDKSLFEGIANDFRATEAVLEFFHVITDDSLFTYDHEEIVSATDHDFALDVREDYSKTITYERKANTVTVRHKALFLIMFLLRDRYFPTFITELLN
jgi:hypothetical protein